MAKSKKVKPMNKEIVEEIKTRAGLEERPKPPIPKGGWFQKWKLRKERKRAKELIGHRKDGYHPAFFEKSKKKKQEEIDAAHRRIQEAAKPLDEIKKEEEHLQVNPVAVLNRRGIKTHTARREWNGLYFVDHLHIEFSNGMELDIIPKLMDSEGTKHLRLTYHEVHIPDPNYLKGK